MNITNPTTFGTPSLTLSTSNSSGTGGALRADDTILVFDTTLPAATGTAATGSASTAGRRDHVHAGMQLAAPALVLGTANSAGGASTALATNSTLLAFDTTLPAAVGVAAVGSATVTSRRDHGHAPDTAPVFGRVVRTAGDITSTNTSLEDVTGATITFTTGAFPVQYAAAFTTMQSGAGSAIGFSAAVDGAAQLGSDGLWYLYPTADKLTGTSFSAQTAALSAAEHVIKLQWKVGANTGTIRADSYNAFIWSAFEIR